LCTTEAATKTEASKRQTHGEVSAYPLLSEYDANQRLPCLRWYHAVHALMPLLAMQPATQMAMQLTTLMMQLQQA
jgi:hypothetical protein